MATERLAEARYLNVYEPMEHSFGRGRVPEGRSITVRVFDRTRNEIPDVDLLVYDKYETMPWSATVQRDGLPLLLRAVVDPLGHQRWDWDYPITIHWELTEDGND